MSGIRKKKDTMPANREEFDRLPWRDMKSCPMDHQFYGLTSSGEEVYGKFIRDGKITGFAKLGPFDGMFSHSVEFIGWKGIMEEDYS